jgi:hypothetical protein
MFEKLSKPLKGFAEDVMFESLSKTSHICSSHGATSNFIAAIVVSLKKFF